MKRNVELYLELLYYFWVSDQKMDSLDCDYLPGLGSIALYIAVEAARAGLLGT